MRRRHAGAVAAIAGGPSVVARHRRERVAELNRLREETFKRLSRSFEPENDL
jgi:hypothetical protein